MATKQSKKYAKVLINVFPSDAGRGWEISVAYHDKLNGPVVRWDTEEFDTFKRKSSAMHMAKSVAATAMHNNWAGQASVLDFTHGVGHYVLTLVREPKHKPYPWREIEY